VCCVCVSLGSYVHVCPSVLLPVTVCLYLLINVHLYLSILLSVYLSFCIFTCLSFCLSFYLSVNLAIRLSVCLSVRLPVCLSVCLSVCEIVCVVCVIGCKRNKSQESFLPITHTTYTISQTPLARETRREPTRDTHAHMCLSI